MGYESSVRRRMPRNPSTLLADILRERTDILRERTGCLSQYAGSKFKKASGFGKNITGGYPNASGFGKNTTGGYPNASGFRGARGPGSIDRSSVFKHFVGNAIGELTFYGGVIGIHLGLVSGLNWLKDQMDGFDYIHDLMENHPFMHLFIVAVCTPGIRRQLRRVATQIVSDVVDYVRMVYEAWV